MMRLLLPVVLSLACTLAIQAQYTWQLLSQSPQNGQKQDDIFMLSPQMGYAVNGSGRIFRTTDGGLSFTKLLDQPGTYFRCIGFTDSLHGFAGNIGTNYFPGVTDQTPLYETQDGGASWAAVTNINGPIPVGLCAINIVNQQIIYAAGRVGSPAFLLKTTNGGANWQSTDLSPYISMITDVWFPSADTGFIFGGTDPNVQFSKAKIIQTTDGGLNWTAVYEGTRTFELCWKAHFPSKQTGYVTLLSYVPNLPARFIGKTVDGGKTWTELPFTNNGNKAFGVGFLDDQTGWVGCDNSLYETKDGGQNWTVKNVGQYINKIRILKTPEKNLAFGIGTRIWRMVQSLVSIEEKVEAPELSIKVYPNPSFDTLSVEYTLEKKAKAVLQLYDTNGKNALQFAAEPAEGIQVQKLATHDLPAGAYVLVLLVNGIRQAETVVLLGAKP
jgi:hypothetical protein